jgi:glycosyltransferase involved in cell wall biosynthesis
MCNVLRQYIDPRTIGSELERYPFLHRLTLRVYRKWMTWRNTLLSARALHSKGHKSKPHVLFYQLSGMSFGGTAKHLQILAKHMSAQEYDVFFMYSPKPRGRHFGPGRVTHRLSYMKNSKVRLLPFDYERLLGSHILWGMSPNIVDIINAYDIDLIVTAPAGIYGEFPLCVIRDVPIVVINVFGMTYDKRNIVRHICMSHEVARRAKEGGVPDHKVVVQYIPSEGPFPDSHRTGLMLRRRLGISDEDIVFGRIGRADDEIFDPIGIRAFQKVVEEKPWIHYLIMSPMPIVRRIVISEQIPNVHFLPPSGDEQDVWAFHCAQDVMAHFRLDGESCGLSIGEAMLCGKPILTHRSRRWNAHMEYLDETCALIADVDDVDQYATYMASFADDRSKERIRQLGQNARRKAERLFLIEDKIREFENWVDQALGVK